MGDNSKIQWTDDTRNFWWGCYEVTAQCDGCYAKTLDKRVGGDNWQQSGPRRAIKSVWKEIKKAQDKAAEAGMIRVQFVMSMGDIFERPMPLVDAKGNALPGTTGDLRDRFFNEVVPASPNLYFLLLTKRPQNIAKYVPAAWLDNPPPNVMYGASVGTGNEELDHKNIEALLAVKGRHFLSCEPLLGPLDLERHLFVKASFTQASSDDDILEALRRGYEEAGRRALHRIDWIIIGGESGNKARPTHPQWLRSIRDQCIMAGVPLHFKQWGEWLPISQDHTHIIGTGQNAGKYRQPRDWYSFGDHCDAVRVGVAAAGRTLDGQTWDQAPNFAELAHAPVVA